MRAVLIMFAKGIHKSKLQTGVFAAGCFFCTFLLMGAFILNYSIEPSFDEAYEKLDAPNTSISIGETVVMEEELRLFMSSLAYVEEYSICKSYLASNVKTPHESMEFVFVTGSADSAIAADKVIANKGTHCNEGDRIEFEVNGKSVSFEVESVVMDAINSAPESMVPYFRIDKNLLESLTTGYEKGNWLIEAKFEDGKMSEFVSDYEKYFGMAFEGDITSYEDIKYSYLFRYEIFSEFILFLYLFFWCIMVVMTVLFSKMNIKTDLKKIGVLKAIGFTNQRIKMMYILRYLAIAIIAGIAGMMVSGVVLKSWLSGIFKNINREIFEIEGLGYYQLLVFIIFSVTIYFVVQVTIHKIVDKSPVDAVNETPDVKKIYLPTISLMTPQFLQLNLGFIKSIHRKLETIFVFVLTLGVSLLFLTSFYLIDSVSNAHSHLEDWGMVEMDIYVSRKTNVDEKQSGLLKALEEDKSVDFYYAALADHITYRLEGNNLTYNVIGDIYDKSIPEELKYTFSEGRNPENTKEAAIGINFAKQNNIGIGDSIYMIRNGKEMKLNIVGIYPSFRQYGNSIRIITEDIKEFFKNQADGYYSIVLKDGEDINAFAKRMSETFYDFDFYPMEKSNVSAVNMLLPPIALCIILFMMILILILFCIKKLMLVECKDDFLKYCFVGFSKKKIYSIMQWRFFIPVFFGMILAVPLSIYMMPVLMSPLANQLGLLWIPIYPNVLVIAITLIGVFCCSRVHPKIKM